MIPYQTRAGFTAVEVMVTLFIIGFLLAAGYQAYALVTSDSNDTRTRAEASNVAYEAMRRASASSTNPCSVIASVAGISIPSTSTLPQPRSITAAISCPYGTSNAVSLVTVEVTYGPSNEKVTHAVYTK